MSVRFQFDWFETTPSPDELACFTMAELSIEAHGEIVTSVRDREKRTCRDHVVVPLIGVVEWLVGNWWHLFHEIEDTREQKPGFESRHNLAYAGDGFVFPDLVVVPSQEGMLLRWKRYKPKHAGIEFLGDGEANVECEELEEQFRILVDAVIERLRSNGALPETLESEWKAINSLDPDEREFCRAAALLGVDPFDASDSLAAAIVKFREDIVPSLLDDALAVGNADSLPELSEWMKRSLRNLEGVESGNDWADMRPNLPRASPAPPWERGCELARSVRRRLGVGDGRFDFDSQGSLAVHSEEARPPSGRVEGLVAADRPACVTAPRGQAGKRFLLGRALGDYLSRSEPGPSLLSSLATDRQALSRAFSAEFLAPAEAIRKRLKGGLAEAEEVDDLSDEFGVPSELIRRQVENHNLATVAGW